MIKNRYFIVDLSYISVQGISLCLFRMSIVYVILIFANENLVFAIIKQINISVIQGF